MPRRPSPTVSLLLITFLLLASTRSCSARSLQDILDDIGDAVDNAVDDVEDTVDEAVDSVGDFFGIGDSEEERQINRQGPIVAKTTRALLHALNATNATINAVVPLEQQASVTVIKPGPHKIVLSFQADEVPANAEDWEGSTEEVPFLSQFVSTAEAPSTLLQVLPPDWNASLTQAVQEAMGEDVLLHVLCTGQGAGGGLAALMSPWAALQFPTASVDTITFGAPWAGFNPQFAWTLKRLATLFYLWEFTAADVAGLPAGSGASSNGESAPSVGTVADEVAGLITTDALLGAISLPNLPPDVPPELSDDPELPLPDLAPPPSQTELPPSDCPVLLCKSTDIAITGCRLFGEGGLESQLQDQPKKQLSSDSGADAVVSWDGSTGSAYIFWAGTDGPEDWFQNIMLVQTDDYRPGNLNQLIPDVEVHRGFYNQFASLTSLASEPKDNITAAILELSAGAEPWRVVVGGHSLGGGLAELTAVWVSTVWPSAHVLVVNTGAPRVGDSNWVDMFRAVVGNAVRYVNQLDVVPALPPFDDFSQVPESLWLRNGRVILLERPSLSLQDLSWDDHSCDSLYVQALQEASAVTVPTYIYDA